MVSQSHYVEFAGRRFVAVVGKESLPSGAYVAHGGRYFPVTPKGGYPLRVVADVAADVAGQLVLVPTPTGALALVSGTDRIAAIDRDDANSDAFSRALLRLMMSTQTNQVIGLGEFSGVPIKVKDLRTLRLPRVIERKRLWLLAGGAVAVIAVGVFAGMAVRSQENNKLTAARTEQAAAMTEMDTLLQTVKAGRSKRPTAQPDQQKAAVNAQPVPVPSMSFSDALREKPLALTGIKVTNGQLATGQARP